MKPHFYPQGAIQTIERLCDMQGMTLFRGYGLGEASFIKATLVGQPTYETSVNGWFFDKDGRNRFCAEDCNVGAHYNQNYIFLTEADAQAYVEWAKVNTDRRW